MGPPAAAGLSPQTWPSSGSYRPRSTSAGSALTSAAIAPVPQARQVPVIQLPHTFEEPRKRISSVMDIDKFQQSETSGKLFLGFVVALSEAIKGHKISDACREGRIVKLLVGILEKMSKWIDDIPPRQQAARYGNPAFRDWHAQLNHQGPALIQEILPEELHPAVVEVFPYFADSCGNSSRIDYGTGHEANFAAFLLCLARLGLVDEGDYQALVARVFVTYLDLMRKLQMTYWLEPAGSHGVWGLDDYHFLPFIFGAAQLTDHKYMKPKSVHNQDILDNFSKEYLYLGCVDFVKKVKKGPLAEHSPMIDDISGVASWNKVHGGMLKMYKVEVLEKVPIMQHFLFGSLIRW
ncbi:hypothetical protein O6H91_04G012800 [Diphasiastrum complanatum]|nr:hypothetical protein O6H91_04G012800 [Diphasiastrum complanatum]